MLTPYAMICGDITEKHLRVYNRVQAVLRSLNSDKTWSCHEVCQILEGSIDELEHCRGWFFKKGQDHSWMRFRDDALIILDAYPVAGASGPLLVSGHGSPWRLLYIEK